MRLFQKSRTCPYFSSMQFILQRIEDIEAFIVEAVLAVVEQLAVIHLAHDPAGLLNDALHGRRIPLHGGIETVIHLGLPARHHTTFQRTAGRGQIPDLMPVDQFL